ncbi:MAG TPA: ABC-2 family transporter protein [Microlunatus sp.]|nr:ABC-2 family transporter protein [Microlunatus sp.]
MSPVVRSREVRARPGVRLPRRLRVFGRLLALNTSLTFIYRGDFFLLQLSNVVVPLISLLVWRAALAAGADLGVDQQYLDAYFLSVSVVAMATASWSAPFLAMAIRNGDLNRSLLRPISPHVDLVANNLGEKVVKVVLLLPVIAIVVWLLPGRPAVPGDPTSWLLGVVAVVLAALLAIFFDIARASLAFWFEDIAGFTIATDLIRTVLSGAVVPLALMPAALASLMAWQPFRFFVSFPIEVAFQQTLDGVAVGFAQQVGWLVIMVITGLGLWRLGLRRYAAAGV